MKKIVPFLIPVFAAVLLLAPGQGRSADGDRRPGREGARPLDPQAAYHALDGRFVADDLGIVTDTRTGLQWVAGPDKDTTWNEAKAWVDGLSLGGGGWRMPTREELSDLYKEGAGNRNMSPLLKTTGGFVWTGETVSSSHAWGFCFDIGAGYWPRRTFCDTARAFAVREEEE